ncbi:MAG TPA: hypothetical protein VEX39_10990 [Thermoleophilaceae bacterium]|nr:hypothetical protein [Thermoleophilaceae bacterium]
MTSPLRKLLPALCVSAPLVLAPAATAKPAFQVDSRAMQSGQYATVYVDNEDGDENVVGTMTVKSGSKALKTNQIELDYGDDYSYGNAVIPRRQRAELRRKGRTKLTVTASVRGTETGQAQSLRKTVTVYSRGKTISYDGYYKGTGGLVIDVQNGFLRSISVGVNVFCSRTREFKRESLYTLSGFPLMIGRDGSFKAKGTQSPNVIRYEGRLTRKGAGKGYLSVFKTDLVFGDGGSMQVQQCLGASNWKAKRSRR